jgi:formylglycine-generating enzyme required for sulfatase activity
MAHDIFISHSAKDKTIADAVCSTLEGRGIRCWIAPRDILPGQDWDTAIISAIKSSKVMVLTFSANSNDSIQVHREVKAAFKKGITVVPLRLENCELNDNLEYYMGSVHWLDAMTPPLEQHLTQLAESVQTLLGIAPIEFLNSIGMQFKLVPAGRFWMGSSTSETGRQDNEQRHQVRITNPFYLGAYQVTQEVFERVVGVNPCYFAHSGSAMQDAHAWRLYSIMNPYFAHSGGEADEVSGPDTSGSSSIGGPPGSGADEVSGLDTRRFPVEQVSWDDARQFCEGLSELAEERAAGRRYRLPTEAEWEYACRAGANTSFSFGAELNGRQANCNGGDPYGTAVEGPFLERTAQVGSYPPNAFGLYDMHGNVFEWCADWYGDYTNSPSDDPTGPVAGDYRIARGGAWCFNPVAVRCAFRYWSEPSMRYNFIGFRVACEVE